MWDRKHLLGLEDLREAELTEILDRAETFLPPGGGADIPVRGQGGQECPPHHPTTYPTLKGKTVLLLFFEPSTRTAMSFELAARRLSAGVLKFTSSGSSTTKGETLIDTARNLEAMGGIDVVVVRHRAAGAPQMLARAVDASIVNAGDGAHEHPTQGLLDVLTIRRHKRSLRGLKVAIVGDIAHSRVARSDIFALVTLGAEVHVSGPATLLPEDVTSLGVRVSADFDELVPEMDVINLLRIQRERMSGPLLPSDREYTHFFGLTRERERRMKPDALVMHPGPINRGVELAAEVADGDHSVILEQVAVGVAVRMAVLSMVLGL